MHNHCFETPHCGTEAVPYGKVIGVTCDGVPIFSNGSDTFFSNEVSVAPNTNFPQNVYDEHGVMPSNPFHHLGIKWMCVEFARRYLAITRGVWMSSVPTAEDLWYTNNIVVCLSSGQPVSIRREQNGQSSQSPSTGDLIIWGRSSETPFGHVAVVTEVSDAWVRIAEQNEGFERWPPGEKFSRQIEKKTGKDGVIELLDEDPLLGWIVIEAPLYDFTSGDIPDTYRHILGPGKFARHQVKRDVRLPWLCTSRKCDCYLKRLLSINDTTGENVTAHEDNVPGGCYLLDYDMWSKIRYATNSLHEIAIEATRRVISDPDHNNILQQCFGIPRELHDEVRRSFEMMFPTCGRFDFGYDGEDIIMLENHFNSFADLLECGDTQENIASHYGIKVGTSTGSFLHSKMVAYFSRLLDCEYFSSTDKLIHFVIDDKDAERCTALYLMSAAEKAGFRTKLCVTLADFRYADSAGEEEKEKAGEKEKEKEEEKGESGRRLIVDGEGDAVRAVWRSWPWDAVLRRHREERAAGAKGAKGAKGAAEAERAEGAKEGAGATEAKGAEEAERAKGAAGATEAKGAARPAPAKPTLPELLLNANVRPLDPLWRAVAGSGGILPFMRAASRGGTGEGGAGKGPEHGAVYQKQVFLSKYGGEQVPIFSGWIIGDEFGGVVVREETQKKEKTDSVVVPARVIRKNIDLHAVQLCSVCEEPLP